MTIEAPVNYINQLNSSYPEATDFRQTADDHLRLIKRAVKASFRNLSAAVGATQTELNLLVGMSATVAAELARVSASIEQLHSRVAAVTALTTSVAKLQLLSQITLTATIATYTFTGIPAGVTRLFFAARSVRIVGNMTGMLGGASATFFQNASSGTATMSVAAIMTSLGRSAGDASRWVYETQFAGNTDGNANNDYARTISRGLVPSSEPASLIISMGPQGRLFSGAVLSLLYEK